MKRFLLWIISVALGVVVLLAAVMGGKLCLYHRGRLSGRCGTVRRAGAGSQRLLLAGAAAGRSAG